MKNKKDSVIVLKHNGYRVSALGKSLICTVLTPTGRAYKIQLKKKLTHTTTADELQSIIMELYSNGTIQF